MSQPTYGPPQPPMGGGYPAPPVAVRNGLGIAALVLGIIGVCSGLIPIMFWLAGIMGVLALVFGLAGRGRAKRGQASNKGVATTGAALGLVSLILAVVGIVITVNAVDDAVDEINKSLEDTTADKKDEKGGEKSGDAAAAEPGSDSGADDAGSDAGSGSETYAAGDTAAYDDGVEVTVTGPTAYTPGEFAAGHEPGNKAYKVTVVIENTGTEKFDSTLTTVDARAGKDGKNAEQIFDGTVGEGFTGTILPGKKASVDFAFSVPADSAGSLDVEVSPSWDYDSNQWNLKP